jgi:hypothetical protein
MYGLHQASNNWFDALCASLLNLGFIWATMIHVYSFVAIVFFCHMLMIAWFLQNQMMFLLYFCCSWPRLCPYISMFCWCIFRNWYTAHPWWLSWTIQPGLIQKIISACGLQDQSAEHNTPAHPYFWFDRTC